MKNLKKMLSVIIVVAMIVTTMLPAFAADTVAPNTDASIAKGLGVVIGGANGVDATYLSTATQRYQAAIIYLRLLGMESTAKAFTGKDNFADAKLLNADMQKYLGYLKANPSYGWLGSGNNKFDPTSVISAQQFYKVLLEALGYKCTVGDVKGDFEYKDTLTFAASKGMTKAAGVAKFTNADLVKAVLETLGVEVKAGGKTLLKTLVDSKVIPEDVAKQYLPDALVVKSNVTTAVYGVTATNGQLTVVMTNDIGGTPANADFTVSQAINGAAATTVTGTVYGYTYSTKTAVINVPVVAEAATEQSVVYSVKYKDSTAVAAPAVVVGASFGIKEVVEPSLKLIKVNLNKDYDSGKDTFTVYKTADTSATVAVTAKAVTGNSKQVLLIASGTYEADVDYTVKVTRDSKDYTKTFKVATDVAVPQIVKAEAIGNKVIRVKFSEPVANANANANIAPDAAHVMTYNYKIGDCIIKGSDDTTAVSDSATVKAVAKKVGSTTVDDVVVSDDLTSVDITLNNALATGEYTLAMVKNGASTNVKDYAPTPYEVPLTSTKFTVSLGLNAATADKLTVNSRSEVAVDFSAAISAPSTSQVFWNTDGVDTNSAKASNAISKTSDTKYTFSFTTNVIPTGKVYFFVKGMTDAYGNSIPTKKFEVTVGTDAVATTTITVSDEQTVKIKYSKDMQNGTATNSGTTGDAANKTHYTVKKSDGTVETINTAAYDSTEKTTTLTLADKLSGNCTISVSGVLDVVGQAVQAVSAQTIVFTDVTAPTVSSVSVVAGSNKIYVMFSEAMITSGTYSALNVANYKWKNAAGPAVTTYSDLPSGTTIAVSSEDSKAIVITLPSGTTTAAATTKVQFGYISGSTIKAVADLAGNVLSIGTEGTAAAVVDGATTIAGQELKITAGNTFRVKVSGTKLNSVSYADFQYTTDNFATNAAPSSAKLIDVDGTQYIEFTTAADAFTSNTQLPNVKVRTINAPSTSTATSVGTKIANNATSAAASTTSFTTTIKSVAIYDNQTVIVKIDGNIAAAAVADFASSVKLYQGTTLIPVTGQALVGSTTQSNIISLSTAANSIDVTGSVTLKTLPVAFITSKDVNGQYIVENQTGVTGSAGFVAGSLARSIAGAANVTTGDTVTINFSMVPKEVSTATVEADGVGKVKVTIANVGTLTGFTSADETTLTGAAASLAISGKTIVVTLTQAGTQANFAFGAANTLKFTPNTALVNTASTAIDGDVAPIK